MPGFREHQQTCGLLGGLVAGAAASVAPGASPLQIAFEAMGGYTAARFTGTLPDVLEPAYFPGHRDVCHAILPVGTALTWYSSHVPGFQEWCREQARIAEAAMAAATPLEALGHLCTAALWYMAAGAVIGAPVGYGVHIIQDSGTANSVGLLMRGL